MNQKGQALMIILLATLVSLTIGLAITQRSLTDVSTSTKIDQSTRAFSAAEAGIEKVTGDNSIINSSNGGTGYITESELGNQSSADVTSSGLIPISSDSNIGLEYPAIDKTSFAQFWLANPDTLNLFYNQNNFDLYFGNQVQDNTQDSNNTYLNWPGVEVTVVTKILATGQYKSYRTYVDSTNRNRALPNEFNLATCSATPINQPSITTYNLTTSAPSLSYFYCKYNVKMVSPAVPIVIANEVPILVRLRVLYDTNNATQKIAIAPTGNSSLPAQVIIYTSKGYSGQTQRNLRLFVQKNVVPFYFDYSIFSSGPICKNINC